MDKACGTCRVIGAAFGLAISGYALIYLPMSANDAECGRVTLCPKPPEEDPEYWRRAMCTQPKYQHLKVCQPKDQPHD